MKKAPESGTAGTGAEVKKAPESGTAGTGSSGSSGASVGGKKAKQKYDPLSNPGPNGEAFRFSGSGKRPSKVPPVIDRDQNSK